MYYMDGIHGWAARLVDLGGGEIRCGEDVHEGEREGDAHHASHGGVHGGEAFGAENAARKKAAPDGHERLHPRGARAALAQDGGGEERHRIERQLVQELRRIA